MVPLALSSATNYFHLVKVDNASNVGTVESSFAITLNSIPPAASSSSHPSQGYLVHEQQPLPQLGEAPESARVVSISRNRSAASELGRSPERKRQRASRSPCEQGLGPAQGVVCGQCKSTCQAIMISATQDKVHIAVRRYGIPSVRARKWPSRAQK